MGILIKKIWLDEVANLTDKFKRINSAAVNSATYFVFKVSEPLTKALKDDERARNEIIGRSQGKSVYLIRYDQENTKFIILKVERDKLCEIKDDALLKEIRDSDLREIIDLSDDCLIEAPSGVHFITPSKKHVIKFLRVADALHSYNALDRISFWLQESMSKAAGVIVDSWSLASIVLGCQQLLQSQKPFDCFNEHILKDEDGALRTLNKLSARITDNGYLLCIISISSSGTFVDKLRNLLFQSHISNEPLIIPLFSFKNSSIPDQPLAKLDFDIDCFEESECSFCLSGDRQKTYQIDPKFYYPRENQQSILRFKKSLVQDAGGAKSEASRFIHDFGKIPGALVVHKNDPNDGVNPRHHAFYIDLLSLLKDDGFSSSVKEFFTSYSSENGCPQVVITPPHQPGNQLGQLAKDLWGATHIEHHNLEGLSEGEKDILIKAEHVCFLDDVFISGTRGSQYLRALREGFTSNELSLLKKISWLPIIARPSAMKTIQTFRDSISNHSDWRTKFLPMFEFELPHWTENKSCPWCQENSVFEKKVGAMWDEPAWYVRRRTLLSMNGIDHNPLFIFPNSERTSLGQASALGDEGCSEMQLLFLIASGLQKLRNDPNEPLGRGLLQSFVLQWFADNSNGTFTRFSEPLIQAVFLKAVKKDEWHDDVLNHGIAELAQRICTSNVGLISGEFILFFLGINSISSLPDIFIDHLLSEMGDDVISLLVNK